MGASHILVVLHPAVEVAVLHKVGGYFNSIAIRNLGSSVAHGLGNQVVSLLSSNNANASTQESRSRAFAVVGNRSVVGSVEVVVFEVVSELGNGLNCVVVGHCVWSLPERAITPLHRDHGGHHWEDPVERPVNTSGDEKPVDDGGAIAGPDQVDVVRISSRVVLRHPRDQLQDEADVVSLALLVVDVPAPLIAAGSHNHSSIHQVAQPSKVALTSIAMEVDDHRDLLSSIGWGNLHLGDSGIVGLLAPRLNNGDLKGATIGPRVGHIGHCDSRTTCHPALKSRRVATNHLLVALRKAESGARLIIALVDTRGEARVADCGRVLPDKRVTDTPNSFRLTAACWGRLAAGERC